MHVYCVEQCDVVDVEGQLRAGLQELYVTIRCRLCEIRSRSQGTLSTSTCLQEREKPGHKIEVDEEYEDAEGNVYNRKTYEDLRRQGLI